MPDWPVECSFCFGESGVEFCFGESGVEKRKSDLESDPGRS